MQPEPATSQKHSHYYAINNISKGNKVDIGTILNDQVDRVEAQNRPPFDSDFDYAQFKQAQSEALTEWKALGRDGQAEFQGNLKNFYRQRNLLPPEDQNFINGKNLHLLNSEIDARVGSRSNLDLIVIDELSYPQPAIELLENTENSDHIKELYRIRKRTTGEEKNSGITTDEARRIKNCLRQGRELYLSSRNGPLMVKPLNLFYSLTAYAYSIIILNNPVRFKLGKR